MYRNVRSEEHTSELQSHLNLVCRLLLEKKKTKRALILQHIITSQHSSRLTSQQHYTATHHSHTQQPTPPHPTPTPPTLTLFFLNDPAPTEIHTLSLPDPLPT